MCLLLYVLFYQRALQKCLYPNNKKEYKMLGPYNHFIKLFFIQMFWKLHLFSLKKQNIMYIL